MNSPTVRTIYAITLNWNRSQDTLDCLHSLLEVNQVPVRVLLVDNASTDGTTERVAERYPQVEQLALPVNLGFGRGFNAGLRYALQHGADYLLIINNDAFVERNTLPELLAVMDSGVGLAAPLIYYALETNRIWSAGGRVSPLLLEMKDEWAGQVDPGDLPLILERDFVTGCCLLFSRQMLEQVGLFDEAFRMYYEDSDLCMRVRRAGWSMRVATRARAWHKVARSSGGADSPNERYWMARSSITFFRKQARAWQIPVILFWRMGSALKTSLRMALARRWQALAAYWRGLVDGLRTANGSDLKTGL